jgi:hypothetical protein
MTPHCVRRYERHLSKVRHAETRPETENFRGPCESSRYTSLTKFDVIPSFISRHLNNLQHFNLQEKCKYLLERPHGSVPKVEIWFHLRTKRRIPSHFRQFYAFNMAR